MSFSPLIKWTGSKRYIADNIINLFPDNIETYIEPFLGGGSILYKTYGIKRRIGNDIITPLIDIYKNIQLDNDDLFIYYELEWNKLKELGSNYYYELREEFNKTGDYKIFFFLTRVCFNGMIRFNNKGGFNSPHHFGRDGIQPEKLKKIIIDWREKIKGVEFYNLDYKELLNWGDDKTIYFFDPPYFNTGNSLYHSVENNFYNEFFNNLEVLNDVKNRWILTFDCDCGENINERLKKISKEIIKVNVNSGFKKLIAKEDIKSKECIYLNYEIDEY